MEDILGKGENGKYDVVCFQQEDNDGNYYDSKYNKYTNEELCQRMYV